jgi:CspA family cold shock protein
MNEREQIVAIALSFYEWKNLLSALHKDARTQIQLGRLAWMSINSIDAAVSQIQSENQAMNAGTSVKHFGTVKWFSDEKGYGFITPAKGGKEVFVHFKGIIGHGRRSLEEGQSVSYEIKASQKGLTAVNVMSA